MSAMDNHLLTVVETNSYIQSADGILSSDERAEIVDMVAENPTCGDIIRGSNGVRKVRFAIGNRGWWSTGYLLLL